MRLDMLLVERGLSASRSRAADAIKRGMVRVDGAPALKPGMNVAADAVIAVDDPAAGYVSRGALKLAHALDVFAIDPQGAICLDIGASTGGFTQVLLSRGAARVYALDVGHGQLAAPLREDSRVVVLEGVNVRDLGDAHLRERAGLIVADVSFISLKLALPAALARAAPGACLVALVKPQFEVGRGGLGKGGIVRDGALAATALRDVADFIDGLPGWRVSGTAASPIAGGEGNREFLLAARFSADGTDW